MRMIVTGREGQVVRSLVERARGSGVEVVPLGRPELDLSGPAERIESTIAEARPDVVVAAAAYTQVDRAESERDLAFAINEHGARAIARASRKLGVPLIHLSTDYVFDGLKAEPYFEADPTAPSGVYGASKLAGERAVLDEHGRSRVLRTAWVYSPFGSNFVKTMLRLAGDRDEVSVVADQRGNPTSALDIADAILAIARDVRAGGIFHMAGTGEASWAELAKEIFVASAKAGGPTAAVKPIATADYPTAGQRPSNSRLNTDKLEQAYGIRLPAWRSSLGPVVTRLVQPGA